MDNDERMKRLEEDLELVYDSLDQRITDLEKRQSDRIALFGVIATIVIGVTQIIIALWK